MKTITKYIILLIIAFMASSWYCQSRGPKQEYGHYEFRFTNKSDLDVKYFIVNTPMSYSSTNQSSGAIKDTLSHTYDLTKIPQGTKICVEGGTLSDQEIRIYLQTEAKKTIASLKILLPLLPKDVQTNKHIYFILQPDNTIKTDIIDVPWEEYL